MSIHSADKVIESIAKVTGHTDRELLEASLASTLYEQFDLESVSIYHVFYEYGMPYAYLGMEVVDNEVKFHSGGKLVAANAVNDFDALNRCLQTKKPFTATTSAGLSLYLHPVVNHLGDISTVFTLASKSHPSRRNEKFVAGYFQIYRNYLRLLDDSEHDSLTGLLNRRTFDNNLEKILAEWHKEHDEKSTEKADKDRRHVPDKHSNWLAVIDIDHFKQVNDRYGHIFGDEVLLLFTKIMRQSFRGYDKLFRFGGEEFVVILRSTDQRGAAKALERFHSAIETYRFPQGESITASVGYIEIASHPVPTQILGLADEALYYAKQHGRNRICQYEELVASGQLAPAEPDVRDDIELF